MTLYNALIVTPDAIVEGHITIDGDRIAAISPGTPATISDDDIDCGGDLIMPGAIDTHVHFREPGLTDKADIASESRAAVAGGVTSFCDMPNTRPATVTVDAWADKMDRAASSSLANYAFFIGATDSNIDQIQAIDYTRCPGVKIFLGASTGNMLMDNDDTLRRIATSLPAGIPLAFHAEDNAIVAEASAAIRDTCDTTADPDDSFALHPAMRPREACVSAAHRVHDLAAATGARCVLLHLSTAEELQMPRLPNLYLETCPHYILFSDECYSYLGARIKCNPAIKTEADCDALRHAVNTGFIDIISTDHAPHLPADKEGDVFTAASGMPGVQFSLPLMLTVTCNPLLVSRLMAANPADIYGIDRRGRLVPGHYADIVRVARRTHTIDDADVLSRCGWTPYDGAECDYTVITTWVNGRQVYDAATGPATTNTPARALDFKH